VLEVAGIGKLKPAEKLECRLFSNYARRADGKDEYRSTITWLPFTSTIQPTRGVIRLTYFDTVERVELPLKIEAGLGL
jgi:hypothetical protein